MASHLLALEDGYSGAAVVARRRRAETRSFYGRPDAPPPNTGIAPAAPTDRNRLALASLVLSLAPFGLIGLSFVAVALVGVLMATRAVSQSVLDVVTNVENVVLAVLYSGSALSSIGAVVTGIVAVRRVGRYPPAQAGEAFAITGLLIGIFALVVYACLGLAVGVCSGSTVGC